MASYQRGYFGTDKTGRPFYVDKSGSMSVPGIKAALKDGDLNRMWMRYIHSFEELLKLRFMATSIHHQKNIDKTTTVVDLKGFSISKLWNAETKGFLKTASKIS
jgi:hypothetical protein